MSPRIPAEPQHNGEGAMPATSGAHAFVWRECPQHPWYGVSVIETSEVAVCAPPLDGTPNHHLPVTR